MGYVAGVEWVKSLFSNIIEVSTLDVIDTAGTYLMLDSVDGHNSVQDKVQLVLVVVGHTLTGDAGVLPALQGHRDVIVNNRHDIEFKFIKRVEMRTTTLFSVAMGFSMLVNLSE
jgi:hypothetical protein